MSGSNKTKGKQSKRHYFHLINNKMPILWIEKIYHLVDKVFSSVKYTSDTGQIFVNECNIIFSLLFADYVRSFFIKMQLLKEFFEPQEMFTNV